MKVAEHCNPWTTQFMDDIMELVTASQVNFPHCVQKLSKLGWWFVFTPEFSCLDPEAVTTFYETPMPPPTKRKIRVAIRCDFCDDYGAQCEFIAKDGTGLQLHKWKVHHIGHRLRHLVPTNVCIYCRRVLWTSNISFSSFGITRSERYM